MFQVIIRKFDLLYAVELSLPPLLFHSVSPSHFETSPFIPTEPSLSLPLPLPDTQTLEKKYRINPYWRYLYIGVQRYTPYRGK